MSGEFGPKGLFGSVGDCSFRGTFSGNKTFGDREYEGNRLKDEDRIGFSVTFDAIRTIDRHDDSKHFACADSYQLPLVVWDRTLRDIFSEALSMLADTEDQTLTVLCPRPSPEDTYSEGRRFRRYWAGGDYDLTTALHGMGDCHSIVFEPFQPDPGRSDPISQHGTARATFNFGKRLTSPGKKGPTLEKVNLGDGGPTIYQKRARTEDDK